MFRQAQGALKRLGFELNPEKQVVHLSRAEQQMVEIAKVFCSDLSILILDEPTASLTEKESRRLFALIEHAKKNRVGIIYITHRMGEIRRISDRITILRDGKYIATVKTHRVTDKELVEMMTGRVIDQIFPRIEHKPSKTVLSLSNVTTTNKSVRNVSMTFKAGEIVGLAGLVGSGKSKIMRACYGIEGVQAGTLNFEGKPIDKVTPSRMLGAGMFYIPPDRRNEGLIMTRNVRENITIAALSTVKLSTFTMFLKRKAEHNLAQELSHRLNLHPLKIERRVDLFSGGNQQKALLAKVLTRDTKLFVFDEPTVGVDVGTRAAIYEFLRDLCQEGAAIALISSDLPEILHLTNRAYVFYRGEVRAELKGAQITEQNVLCHFFGQEAA
jgi:ribose transport system ATP-binding protein